MISLSLISYNNYISNKDKFKEKNYFETNDFKSILARMSEDIVELNNTEFKDYEKKSDKEKVADKEIADRKKSYQANLDNQLKYINDKYDSKIKYAQSIKDNDQVNKLTDAKETEIELIKKQYSLSDDEIRNNIIEEKNNFYKAVKREVSNFKGVFYYIKDNRNNDIYTNLVDVADIETYLSEHAFYYIDSVQKLSINASLVDNSYNYIVEPLNQNSLDGYFVILKDNKESYPYINEYNNYDANRSKFIYLSYGGILAAILAIAIMLVSKKTKKQEFKINKNILKIYFKIPIDIKILFLQQY